MPMGMDSFFRQYFYLAAALVRAIQQLLRAQLVSVLRPSGVEADQIRSTIKPGIRLREERLTTPPRLFATEEKNGRGGRANLGLRRGSTVGLSRVQSMMVGP